MTASEQQALLDEQRVAIVSSNGPRRWPHSMPMWFVVNDGEIWIWTYAKSQKVKNIERDPRATVLVEAGHDYQELRGLQIEAETEIIREPDRVLEFGLALTRRYSDGAQPDESASAAIAAQAAKRAVLRFEPIRVASWDHRKLGGTY